MAGEKFEHVIEKANAGRYVVLTIALDLSLIAMRVSAVLRAETRRPRRATPGSAIRFVGRIFLRVIASSSSAQLGKLVEPRCCFTHLFARADGDANRPFAAGIVRSVAHQHSTARS